MKFLFIIYSIISDIELDEKDKRLCYIRENITIRNKVQLNKLLKCEYLYCKNIYFKLDYEETLEWNIRQIKSIDDYDSDIIIKNSNFKQICLNNLYKIEGELKIINNIELVSLQLKNLSELKNLVISNNLKLTFIQAQNLNNLINLYINYNHYLINIKIDNLVTAENIFIYGNNDVSSLNLNLFRFSNTNQGAIHYDSYGNTSFNCKFYNDQLIFINKISKAKNKCVKSNSKLIPEGHCFIKVKVCDKNK